MVFCPLSGPLLINFTSSSSFIFSFNSDSILPGIDDLSSLKSFDFTSLFICHSIGQQALRINNPPIFYVWIYVACRCLGLLVSWSSRVVACWLFGLLRFLACQRLDQLVTILFQNCSLQEAWPACLHFTI